MIIEKRFEYWLHLALYGMGFFENEVTGGGGQNDPSFKIFNNDDIKLKLFKKPFKREALRRPRKLP